MATKQTEIRGAATVQDGLATTNNDTTLVWSSLRYPLTLTMPISRFGSNKEPGSRHETAFFTIKPGPNRVPSDMWNHNKTRATIVRRLDERDLVPSATAPGDHKSSYNQISEGHAPSKSEMIGKLQPMAGGVSVASSLKDVGAPKGVADMDSHDDNAIIING